MTPAPFDFSKVLSIGSGGMIGAYVDFGMRPGRRELDIMDEDAVFRYVSKHKPRVILHLAGATDMGRCERDPLYAYELNVRGTHNIARAACAVGAVLVYVSTTRVFRGDKEGPYTETDAPDPQTHYGMTKYLGELITATVPKYIIVRTAWVFGGGPERDNKFYGSILRQLQSGSTEIVGLNDVWGSPTYAKDFVAATKDLLVKAESGVFHVVNTGVVTRYDLAKAIAAETHRDVRVHAVDRSHFASATMLPKNEAASSQKVFLRPWREALSEYITDEWSSSRHSATITP
jgi:dTDP-4-dehydrorhamnose reductase